jgi:hypothetical protein
MKTLILRSPLLLFAFLQVYFCQAQTEPDTLKLWTIEMNNENEYLGKIISRDSEKIVFETRELGRITINVRDIKSIREVIPDQIVEGEYWFENPQATRYFWAPTGYGLRRETGYYQNVWIFFNQFSYGFSDNFSIGVGIVPLFLFGGLPTPIWITPKVSIPLAEKFHLGAGALIGTVVGEDAGGGFGIAYGTTTFGTRDRNFNLGLGYGFADGDWARHPTVTLSAMVRTGRRGYLLTENYVIDTGYETLVLLSLGGRRVGKKLSLDFGGILPISSDFSTFVAIPWLGISVPLGKNNDI